MDLHKELVGALHAIMLGSTALVMIALLAALAGPMTPDRQGAAERVPGAGMVTSGPLEHA
jgi:hypothetical protein